MITKRPPLTPLQTQTSKLLDSRQYKSAELLALMELSNLRHDASQTNPLTLASMLHLLADACHRQQRYRSSVRYYREGIELIHAHYDDTKNNKLDENNSNRVKSQWEAELRIAECRALFDSGMVHDAVSTLERCFPITNHLDGNASNGRHMCNVECHMLLGGMYVKIRRKEDAIQEYKWALSIDPYVLEAVECLAKLGCDEKGLLSSLEAGIDRVKMEQKEILRASSADVDSNNNNSEEQSTTIQDNTNNATTSTTTTALPEEETLRQNASAQTNLHKNQLQSSLKHYTELTTKYPYHPYFLLHLANIQQELGHILPSEQNYKRIRALDQHWTEGMDHYAHLLFQLRHSRKNAFVMGQGGYLHYHYSCHGNRDDIIATSTAARERCGIEVTLGELGTDMLSADDKKPESWNCLGLYHLSREDHEKALAFLDKAIALKPEYAFSHLLRGSILLASHRSDHARSAFFRANNLQRDIPSFEGLVESYLANGQHKEAVCSAKEAISVNIHDARALTLVGLALAQAPPSSVRGEGKEKAKRALKKAIALDQGALRPLFALVDIYASEGEYATCIKLLHDGIENGGKVAENSPLCAVGTWNKAHTDIIRAKMAEIHTLNEEYGDALECYHIALALNPQNGLAQQGIERVEKFLNGIDPDEEEEMGEVDDDEMHDDDGEYY
eukprot:scaffold249370_cov63-Cyclotella_meneghiniana.AAC.1